MAGEQQAFNPEFSREMQGRGSEFSCGKYSGTRKILCTVQPGARIVNLI
jgi:hypothetical protein